MIIFENMNKEQINLLIQGIFDGDITTENIPTAIYRMISEKLLEAFPAFEAELSPTLISELTENIYMFSGAKSYHLINDISLVTKDNAIKGFAQFKAEALKIYNQYNVDWLNTEYNTTIATGQTIVRWKQIEEQKQQLPFLTYSAIIDSNTSEICKPLDGITLPADHPFWNKNAPLNHFNCRCVLIQKDKFDAKITKPAQYEKAEKAIDEKRQELFENNPGKGDVIFDKDHPYFKVAPGDKELAKNNFNLPVPLSPKN